MIAKYIIAGENIHMGDVLYGKDGRVYPIRKGIYCWLGFAKKDALKGEPVVIIPELDLVKKTNCGKCSDLRQSMTRAWPIYYCDAMRRKLGDKQPLKYFENLNIIPEWCPSTFFTLNTPPFLSVV